MELTTETAVRIDEIIQGIVKQVVELPETLRVTIILSIVDTLSDRFKVSLCKALCYETIKQIITAEIKQSKTSELSRISIEALEDITLEDVASCIDLLDYVRNNIGVRLVTKGMGGMDLLTETLVKELASKMTPSETTQQKFKELEETIRKLREKRMKMKQSPP